MSVFSEDFFGNYSSFGEHKIIDSHKVRWSESNKLVWVLVEFAAGVTKEMLDATGKTLGHNLVIELAVASIRGAHDIWEKQADATMVGKDDTWSKIAKIYPNTGGCCICHRNESKWKCYLKSGFIVCDSDCLKKLKRICKLYGAGLGDRCVAYVDK